MKLLEVLNAKPQKVLKNAVRDWGVPSSERRSRATMVPALERAILAEEELFEKALLGVDATTYRFFQAACESGTQRNGGDLEDRYHVIESCPFVSIKHVGYDCELEVPDEIRALYEKVLTSAFINQRCRQDYLVENMNAAVNLYGVISYREMAELFNAYNKGYMDEDCRRTTEGELRDTCWTRKDGWDVQFAECSMVPGSRNVYLVNKVLCGFFGGTLETDVGRIEAILEARSGLMRWTPEYHDFHKLAKACDTIELDRLASAWDSYGKPGAVPSREQMNSRTLTSAHDAVRELTLALMFLTRSRTKRKKGFEEPWEAWTDYEHDVVDELHEKDYIRGNRRMRFAIITKGGMAEARRIISKYGIEDWETLKGECDWPERYDKLES